jgi:FKBP-type peptidyl-prolyl cis-trans isomerase
MTTSWLVRSLAAGAALLTAFALGCQRPQGEAPPAPKSDAATSTPARPAAPAPEQAAKPAAPAKERAAVAAARKLGTSADQPAVTTASGLQYIDVKQGSGAAVKSQDMVAVHYTGWLVDGAKFDSSLDRGEPFMFSVGRGMVIKGWDEGLVGMKPGGVRKLIIPPQLGYGETGSGPIPANATLIFEIRLLKAQK